jgi:hypothetical protein
MGTVLALSIMNKGAAALVGLAILAGCGNDDKKGSSYFDAVRGLAQSLTGNGPEITDVRAVLTRDLIDETPSPLLLAELPERGASAGLIKVAPSGQDTVWIASDGISITFRHNGLLVATRGLGDDLMAADLSQVQARIQTGGRVARVHDHLNGNDQIVRLSYDCIIENEGRAVIDIYEIRYQTTVMAETCQGDGESFTNRYWITDSGIIQKSIQWVSPSVKYLISEQLQ